MSIEAARKRGEPLDHVLFSAPPGLGKTSLAHIIARELGVNLRVTSGPAIERAGDLAGNRERSRRGPRSNLRPQGPALLLQPSNRNPL